MKQLKKGTLEENYLTNTVSMSQVIILSEIGGANSVEVKF